MYDFLDKIGLKAVLEAVKGKMPSSLPANGGNADTVDGLHADDFFQKNSQIQFTPYNMKYYELNGRICLYSEGVIEYEDGIYFKNTTNGNITVCFLVSAVNVGALCQYGYGTGVYPDMMHTGKGREWYSNVSVSKDIRIYSMDVPPEKTGYIGIGSTTFPVTYPRATIHDVKCQNVNFF